MAEESPDSFQLYRDCQIPCETTATGRELPTIHTYLVIMSPAGLELTWQRCVASYETNFAIDWAIPERKNDAKMHTAYCAVSLESTSVFFLHPVILFLEFWTVTCVIVYFNVFSGSKALEMPIFPLFWMALSLNAITAPRHFDYSC